MLNSSILGYRGGGFGKKSRYKMGRGSYYSSFCDREPSKFFANEHPCSSNPFNFKACSLALFCSNVATSDNLSSAIFPRDASCLHALTNTTGWKSSDRSYYSPFNRPPCARKTHCFTSSNLRPNFLIQSEGYSHSDQNYSHYFGIVRSASLVAIACI